MNIAFFCGDVLAQIAGNQCQAPQNGVLILEDALGTYAPAERRYLPVEDL